MYHRFNENKYPSTNIRNEIFLEHLKEINNLGIEFITFEKFEKIIKTNIDKNYLLLTIDDAFESFYLNAWPILKNKQIPFVLFVSTREIGKHGYMNWEQIKELDSNNLVTIGNHSHSHEYLIDWKDDKIKYDLETSIKIFKKELEYSPTIFSYPFGEYSSNLKKIVKNLGISSVQFDKCLIDEVISDKILNDRIEANKKYSINSTPTIIINEKKLEGSASFKNIKKKIERII